MLHSGGVPSVPVGGSEDGKGFFLQDVFALRAGIQ